MSTHPDNTTGDIIYWDGIGALSVKDFFEGIIGVLMTGLKESCTMVSMFLLTCAGAIANKESREMIKDATKEYVLFYCSHRPI